MSPGRIRAADSMPFLDCGEISRSNNSWQFGPNAWVQYIVETSRSINLCPIEVEVEAWVNGVREFRRCQTVRSITRR